MKDYVIWGRPGCVWCDRAKHELTIDGIEFDYVELRPSNLEEFTILTNGAKTVPQILYRDKLIGGYEALINWLGNPG